MAHATMDVDIYNVSIHGWANNGFRTTNCLPSVLHHAISAQVPIPSRLPDRPQTPEDDTPRLCLSEFLVLAAPRETNSFHHKAHMREKEAKRAVLDGSEQLQIKALDLPHPNHNFHIWSWLSY